MATTLDNERLVIMIDVEDAQAALAQELGVEAVAIVLGYLQTNRI